jgi:hypothetical protein
MEEYEIQGIDAMKWVICNIKTQVKYGPYESKFRAEEELQAIKNGEERLCSVVYDM